MGPEKRVTGSYGEEMALRFLKRRGYRILERNYRTPFGEIDAIAKKKYFMIFVEVKTRLSSSLGPPYLSVTTTKQKHITKNALWYMKRCGKLDSAWRVDIVSVKLDRGYKIEHIEIIENAVEDND